MTLSKMCRDYDLFFFMVRLVVDDRHGNDMIAIILIITVL